MCQALAAPVLDVLAVLNAMPKLERVTFVVQTQVGSGRAPLFFGCNQRVCEHRLDAGSCRPLLMLLPP